MGKRKTGLTVEEHIALGAKIKRLNKELREVAHIIVSSYGKTSQAGSRALRSVISANLFDRLCSDMDAVVVRETERNEWDVNGYGWIYMGGNVDETFCKCTKCGRYVVTDRAVKTVGAGVLCQVCK